MKIEKLKNLHLPFTKKRKRYFHLFKANFSYLFNLVWLSYLKLYKKPLVAISLIEHIGDIIACEPISREIRARHPEAFILWFVRKPYRSLLSFNPNINSIVNVNCLNTWIKIKNRIKFAEVYDLHFNGRSCKICQVAITKNNVDQTINGTNYLNSGSLLKAVCMHNKIEVQNMVPQLYIPKKIKKKLRLEMPLKYIIIHGRSNEEIKDWTPEKWTKLTSLLINQYDTLVVELGNHNLVQINHPKYRSLCGKLSLLDSAALIENAALFIGIDSGPAHMANAAGTPGIILLGEYYYGMKNYNPYSGNYGNLINCELIQSDKFVKDISVETVSNYLERFI